MRIAVITAIYGDHDQPKPFPPQSVECDYYCFLPGSDAPMPNLPPRLQAKFIKLQPWRFVGDYDAFVWVDGNIEVTSPDFVKAMTEDLYGIRIQRHHERQTIGQEIEFILNSDNAYLTTRYGAQPLAAEYAHYLCEGMPDTADLYACNIFAWYSRAETVEFFNDWWALCLLWSWFDQSAFSYLAWLYLDKHPFRKVEVEPVALGPMFNNPYFILHPHNKMQ